jgi:pimeloyl-ACP methyl ester carboxylesterase
LKTTQSNAAQFAAAALLVAASLTQAAPQAATTDRLQLAQIFDLQWAADPRIAPDGNRIAYTGFDDRKQGYQIVHLYVMGRDGSRPRVVTAGLDCDVDSGRLFVTGGSGGGVLTAWIVGHTDRFQATVVAKPVINWYSWVLTSDLSVFGTQYGFGALPWDDLQNYMRRSPVSYAGNVKTPTMVMTGELDYRTPSSDAEQFYAALQLRKVPSMMVRIPDASHDIAGRPSNMMAKVAYVLGWFERYGGNPQAPQND